MNLNISQPAKLRDELNMSKSQVMLFKERTHNLQETMSETQITSLSSRLFNIDRFKQDEDISFYTGLQISRL